MRENATVIFWDSHYLAAKEGFINHNYNAERLVTLNEKLEGAVFMGMEALPLKKALNDIKGKIIIAAALSVTFNKLIKLLLDMGACKDDIVFTFNAPGFINIVSDTSYLNELSTVAPGVINYSLSENGDIVCETCGGRLLASSYDELFIVKEIFYYMCYDFTTPHKSITVLDIGMNIGTASIFFASKEGVNRVYGFEPFPATFERAMENFAFNGLPEDKVFPHLFGAGKENGTIEADYDGCRKGHMSTSGKNESFPGSEKVTVEIVDIAEIFTAVINRHPEDRYVFKIDCEGGEYDILERLDETGLLKKVHILILEWHKFGDRDVTHLERVLERNGFIYHVTGSRHDSGGMLFAVEADNELKL